MGSFRCILNLHHVTLLRQSNIGSQQRQLSNNHKLSTNLSIVRLIAGNRVDTDDVVSVTSIQVRAISRPGQRDGVWDLGVLADGVTWDADFVNHVLGFKIPDLDGGAGGSNQPVAVRREDQGVDDVVGFQRVQALAFRKIPKHSNTVLSTGGAKRAIRRDSDSVQVASVASKVVSQTVVVGTPNLDKLVPTSGDDDWGTWGWWEANAGHPFGVAVFGQGELAFTKGVPELHGAISGGRHDLTVVSREGNREDVLGVADESAGALAGGDFPKAKGTIPRAGKGILTIRTDDNVRDEAVVATKSTLSISDFFAVTGKSPDHDGLRYEKSYISMLTPKNNRYS